MRGGCLCGAARFTVTGAPDAFFLCHCSRCRKGSGSAHAANIFAAEATLDWDSTGPMTTYRVPDSRHERQFCATCGSPLPVQSAGMTVIPAGSLDDAPPLRPMAHICGDSRAEWDHDLHAVPTLPGLPG